jgi:hypothetical protein
MCDGHCIGDPHIKTQAFASSDLPASTAFFNFVLGLQRFFALETRGPWQDNPELQRFAETSPMWASKEL